MALRHEITECFCYAGNEPSGSTNAPVDQINTCSSKTMLHTTLQSVSRSVAQPGIRWGPQVSDVPQSAIGQPQSVGQSVSQ